MDELRGQFRVMFRSGKSKDDVKARVEMMGGELTNEENAALDEEWDRCEKEAKRKGIYHEKHTSRRAGRSDSGTR